MTNLKPITSEEVLARQVREAASAASGQGTLPTSNGTLAGDSKSSASDIHTLDVKGSPPQEARLNTDNSTTEGLGFTYRLPLGAYLLAFMYLQVSLFALVMGVLSIVIYMQYSSMQSTSLWEIINRSREIWIVMVVSMLLSIFIFSGRKILRLFVIAACSILTLMLGYQIFNTIASILRSDSSDYGLMMYLSSAILVGLLALSMSAMLTIVTILYLLRKKVSAVYE